MQPEVNNCIALLNKPDTKEELEKFNKKINNLSKISINEIPTFISAALKIFPIAELSAAIEPGGLQLAQMIADLSDQTVFQPSQNFNNLTQKFNDLAKALSSELELIQILGDGGKSSDVIELIT